MQQQAAWISCLSYGLWPLSSHRDDAEQPRWVLCTQWICVIAEKSWIYETSIVYIGLPGNLPNFCPRETLFLLHWAATNPALCSLLRLFTIEISLNIQSQMSINVRDPWWECLPTISIFIETDTNVW